MTEQYITLKTIKNWLDGTVLLSKADRVNDATFIEMVFPETLVGDPKLHKVWERDTVGKDGMTKKNKRRSVIMNGKCGAWNGTQFREIGFQNRFIEKVKQHQNDRIHDFILQTENRCQNLFFNRNSKYFIEKVNTNAFKMFESHFLALVQKEQDNFSLSETTKTFFQFLEDLKYELIHNKVRALSWMMYYAIVRERITEILPFDKTATQSHILVFDNPYIEMQKEIEKLNMQKAEDIAKSYSPQNIERVLSSKLKSLRVAYRKHPNPLKLYEVIYPQTTVCHAKNDKSAISLKHFGNYLFNNYQYYYYGGLIYEFLGRTLINSASLSMMREARELLQKAYVIYSNILNYTEREIKRIVIVKWLHAVSYKLEQKKGLAVKICSETLNFIHDEEDSYELYYSDTNLPIKREIAILENDENLFLFLVKDTRRVQYNNEEAFHTYRRIFEYYLNRNNEEMASRFVPKMLEYYWKCRGQLPKIYDIDMLIYMFQYYSLKGDTDKGLLVYSQALKYIVENNLPRKQNKLISIKQQFYEL
jgi:hypothetical protein